MTVATKTWMQVQVLIVVVLLIKAFKLKIELTPSREDDYHESSTSI